MELEVRKVGRKTLRQPYPSWVFDEVLQDYVAPIPCELCGTDGKIRYWNEDTLSWEVANFLEQ